MRDEIIRIIKEVLPQIDIDSLNLVDGGIIDSMSIVVLVSELSERFNISFDLDDLDAKTFNSIDSIVEIVAKKLPR